MLFEVKPLLDLFPKSKNHQLLTLVTNLNNLQTLLLKKNGDRASQLSESAAVLLLKSTLLTYNLLKIPTSFSKTKLSKQADHLNRCIINVKRLIHDHKSTRAYAELTAIVNSGYCDLPVSSNVFYYYGALAIDAVTNGLNRVLSGIFRMSYVRSRLAIKSFITDDLDDFLLLTKQSTAGKILTALRPTSKFLNKNNRHTSHLGLEINGAYRAFIVKYSSDAKLKKAACDLIITLNTLAKISLSVENNQVLSTAVAQAFLANQDAVFGLLTDKQAQSNKIIKLTACLQQTNIVIQNPGKPGEIAKLIKLVGQADDAHRQCDREKTSYAVIHVVVSAVLLGVAILEALASHSVSLMTTFWTISAEVASLGVAGGQFCIFANSHVQKTIFSETMASLAKVTTLATQADDWTLPFCEDPRQAILITLQKKACNQAEPDITCLLSAFNRLKRLSHTASTSIIRCQALNVLQTGQDVAIDMLRAKQPSIKRLQKLQASIQAAITVINNPLDKKAVETLTKFANNAGYERYIIDKNALFLGALQALACVAIFIVTITGTIFSAGMTAGTILSPIMLTGITAKKLLNSVRQEKTSFSDQLIKLSQYTHLIQTVQKKCLANNSEQQNHPRLLLSV